MERVAVGFGQEAACPPLRPPAPLEPVAAPRRTNVVGAELCGRQHRVRVLRVKSRSFHNPSVGSNPDPHRVSNEHLAKRLTRVTLFSDHHAQPHLDGSLSWETQTTLAHMPPRIKCWNRTSTTWKLATKRRSRVLGTLHSGPRRRPEAGATVTSTRMAPSPRM